MFELEFDLGSEDLLFIAKNFSNAFNTNSVFRYYSISIFTDLSKIETGTSSRILSGDLNISVSLRLTNARTVFQDEIYTINVAAKRISQFSFFTSTIDMICH